MIELARTTFGVFGTACFLAYLWATHVVPETANVSLKLIDELFRFPKNQGDILVKRQVCAPSLIFRMSSFLLSLVRWNEILDYTI
jgi:hypothetical protein